MMWQMLRREFLAQLALLARAGQLDSLGSVFETPRNQETSQPRYLPSGRGLR